MKSIKISIGSIILLLLVLSGCEQDLTNANINPNAVSPETANPNQIMPKVMVDMARSYTSLGYGNIGGVMQHMQEDAWKNSYNDYQWDNQNWSNYYGMLRNNKFVYEKAQENNQPFLEGMALTMKSLIFGKITDLWGDAPYTEALKASDDDAVLTPAYDSQDVIYQGILEDLKEAASIFEAGNTDGSLGGNDVYFGGDINAWHRFANSLILKYSMRVSEKMPDVARSNIEEVYNSGIYFTSSDEDVSVPYNDADFWPAAAVETDPTNFRRRRICNTLLNKLYDNNDPRKEVWVRPVHCQWVEDRSLDVPVDPYIRENGELTDVVSYSDAEYLERIAAGNVYTRHFNPDLVDEPYDTREYVGTPPQLFDPSGHNGNPTPGQQLQNQHVSQMADLFRQPSGEFLESRIITAAEVSFVLAEAAWRGMDVGNGENHYNNAVQQALNIWGVGDHYSEYIQNPGVAFNNTLEQIIEQKWIAAFAIATEAWFDYRRTGYPELSPGPSALEAAVPFRFRYGNDELNFNTENVQNAIQRLEPLPPYTDNQGSNSQWHRPWLVQGTNNP
ncbi:MAG: SusD/RagB family nutrient-binding outer membrane lipoprotein [Balneolaceae bacterium]|nr:SusD/RagB family nutrient-binding outer membrane lipoprotein [Balneolaceae bacterium]